MSDQSPPPTAADAEESQVRAISALLSSVNWSITFEDRRRQARVAHPNATPLQTSLMAATDVVTLVASLHNGSNSSENDLDSLLSPVEPIALLQHALRMWLSEYQQSSAPSPAAVAPSPDSMPAAKGLLARTTRLGASMGSTLIAATTNLTQKSAIVLNSHLARRHPFTAVVQAAVEGIDTWATRWLAWDSSVTAARAVLEELGNILSLTTPAALPKQIPVYSGVRDESSDRPSLSRFPQTMDQWRPHWASLGRAIQHDQDRRRAIVNEALAALPLDGNTTAPTEDEGLEVFITRLAGVSDDWAPLLFLARGTEFPDGTKDPRPDLVMVFSVGNTLEDVLSYMLQPPPSIPDGQDAAIRASAPRPSV